MTEKPKTGRGGWRGHEFWPDKKESSLVRKKFGIRLKPSDMVLIEHLREKLGLNTKTQVIERALKALLESLNDS